MTKVSIVIPCLNENETVWIVVKKALDAFKKLGIDWEVVVSDNWSTDGSIQIAQDAWARVVHAPYKWYGNALKHWFTEAYGELMIMWDADDSYNFDEIWLFLDAWEKNNKPDIVIWNRLKTVIPWAMPPLHRYLGTPVLTKIINIFFGTKIWDCNCGMRLITKDAYKRLNMKSWGMEFASEMIIKAGLHKFKITEIVINLYRDGRMTRRPHLNTWRDWWRHLKYMMLLAPYHILQLPWIILSILWYILLLSQVAWPLQIGSQLIDIHFMILWFTLAVIGNILYCMWLIIKPFAKVEWLEVSSQVVTKITNTPLEKFLIVWFGIFLLWLIIDVTILRTWLFNFGSWDPAVETRKAIYGAYFMFLGLMIFFWWFGWKMIENKEK